MTLTKGLPAFSDYERLPFHGQLDEAREVGFGFMDVDGLHGR